MALTSLMRTVWSARLTYNLHKTLVYGMLTNRDYEGDIQNANLVKINQIAGATVGDYDNAAGMGTPELLASTSQDLSIDQRKYFNFMVSDIDKMQTNIEVVDNSMFETSYKLADIIDQYVAGFYTSIDPLNQIGSDVSPLVVGRGAGDKSAYDMIVDLGVNLDEANVPREGRFAVVPAWFLGLLSKDSRFTLNPVILQNGLVQGQIINGAQIYMSNNCPNPSSKFKIICGNSGAIAFADGLREMERYRPEKFFADAIRGLFVYGAKMVYTRKASVLTCTKGTLT